MLLWRITGHRLPIEFRLLHYTPTPLDGRGLHADRCPDGERPEPLPLLNALTREKILAKLGPELTADLYVNSSTLDRPPTVLRSAAEWPVSAR